MGFEPNINLEASKAGPRPGFDSCPRVTESGTTGDMSIQGQGSSHSLEAPLDVFEARREVEGGIPSEGGIEPLDPIAWNRDPHDYQMEHGLPLEFPANSSPEIIGTRPMRVVRRSPPRLLS
jgi:hypothetical protein